MMFLYPRSVYFKDGKAVSTFEIPPHDHVETMWLPSDHYDFLGPVNIYGKTKEEILTECENYPCN